MFMFYINQKRKTESTFSLSLSLTQASLTHELIHSLTH